MGEGGLIRGIRDFLPGTTMDKTNRHGDNRGRYHGIVGRRFMNIPGYQLREKKLGISDKITAHKQLTIIKV